MKLLILSLFAVCLFAQPPRIDALGGFAPSSGTSLPTNCKAGQLFTKLDAAAGANVYVALATASPCTTWTSQGGVGSGITAMTVSTGAPVASCAAPSNNNLILYTDSSNQDVWACVATNTWKKILSVSGSGPTTWTFTPGTAPGQPGGSLAYVYSDSTLKGLSVKDDAGQVTRTVKPTDCSAGLMQKINQDGTVGCASVGGGVPGGADTQVQYNSSGAFAGSGNLTYSGGLLHIKTSDGSAGFLLEQGDPTQNQSFGVGYANTAATGASQMQYGISGGVNQFFGGTTAGDMIFKGYTQDSTKRVFIGAGGNGFNSVGIILNPGGRVDFASIIAGSSAIPTIDATSCTGATIFAGSTNTAGKITGLPSGSCTIVLSYAFGGAFVGTTAAHDMNCFISNKTTPANVFVQTNFSSATGSTFAGTSTAGDEIRYMCVGW